METPTHDENTLSSVPPAQPPKTSIPKTIGTLNIVFGSLMLLCAFCSGLSLLWQSTLAGPMMAMQQQQMQQAMLVQRQQMVAQLKAREEASKDEKEKANLRVQQKAVEAQPVPKMPNFNKIAEDPSVQGFSIVDTITGFVLNVLMVISGIALLSCKEWGRVCAIWVAIFKMLRLIGLYTFYALVLVPVMVSGFNDMFKEMFDDLAKGAPPGQRIPGPEELAQIGTVIGIGMTAFAIAMIIFGVIYPVIVLIALTRPRAKAACAPAPAKMD